MSATAVDTKPVKMPKLRSTRNRLLAVADLIETFPREWDQSTWAGLGDGKVYDDEYTMLMEVARRRSCGSFGCAAGWGVAHTPVAELARMDPDEDGDVTWEAAGCQAFGIHPETGDVLFAGGFGSTLVADQEYGGLRQPTKAERALRMTSCLRYLASLSDGARLNPDVAEYVRRFHNGDLSLAVS